MKHILALFVLAAIATLTPATASTITTIDFETTPDGPTPSSNGRTLGPYPDLLVGDRYAELGVVFVDAYFEDSSRFHEGLDLQSAGPVDLQSESHVDTGKFRIIGLYGRRSSSSVNEFNGGIRVNFLEPVNYVWGDASASALTSRLVVFDNEDRILGEILQEIDNKTLPLSANGKPMVTPLEIATQQDIAYAVFERRQGVVFAGLESISFGRVPTPVPLPTGGLLLIGALGTFGLARWMGTRLPSA